MQNTFFKIVYTTLLLILIFAPLQFDFLYIQKYISAWSNETLYINDDTTWNNDTNLSDYHTVYIENNATLTIEKGAHIMIPDVRVYEGRIVAEGAIDENIVLSSVPVDTSEIEDYEDYDPECFESGSTITFDIGLAEFDFPSIFKHVEFSHMGTNVEFQNAYCPGGEISYKVKKPSVINAVHAYDINIKKPAIHHLSGKLEMENVIFDNNNYADVHVQMELEEDYNEDSYVHIKNSNFQNNHQNTAVISEVIQYDYDAEDICYDDCDDEYDDHNNDAIYDACCELCESEAVMHNNTKVVLRSNWYGDVNGPSSWNYQAQGVGERVIGNYTRETDDFRGSSDFASNVLFLPGTKASKLYDQNNQVWPPTPGGNDYKNLLLDEDGDSIKDIYPNKPIDEVGLPGPMGTNIYKSFIGDLEKLKSDKIVEDVALYAYDWRYGVDDIAKNGTHYKRSSIKNPISEVMRLADSSVSGKVTIVAHSNGGLLAKAIMQQLEILNMTDKIDNIVMVSSPQMGTPKAILTMLYGFDEKLPLPGLITNSQARQVVENMPGAYGLLPTQEYFSRVDYDIIDFESENTKYKKYKGAYGDHINDYDEFRDFLLAKKDNRHKPDKDDIDNANILNEKLFDENSATRRCKCNSNRWLGVRYYKWRRIQGKVTSRLYMEYVGYMAMFHIRTL